MRGWKPLVGASVVLCCITVTALFAVAKDGSAVLDQTAEMAVTATCADLARSGGFADVPYTCVEKADLTIDGAAQIRRTKSATDSATMLPEGIESESTVTNVTEVVNGKMTSDDPGVSKQLGRYPSLVTVGPNSSIAENTDLFAPEPARAAITINLENCACAGCRRYSTECGRCCIPDCNWWCCYCLAS